MSVPLQFEWNGTRIPKCSSELSQREYKHPAHFLLT